MLIIGNDANVALSAEQVLVNPGCDETHCTSFAPEPQGGLNMTLGWHAVAQGACENH